MKLRIKHRKRIYTPIGDLDTPIIFCVRKLTAAVYSSASPTMAVQAIGTEWAAVSTLSAESSVAKGIHPFSKVNIPAGTTHVFTIRYNEIYTPEHLIELAEQYYKILRFDDPENRHEFWLIYAQYLGDKSKAAAK